MGRGKKRGVEAEVEKQRDTQRYTETHTHTQTHTHTLSLSISTSFVRTTIDGCHQVSTSGTVQEFEPGWAFDAAAAPHHPAPCCAQPAPRVSSRLCTWTERLCVCVCAFVCLCLFLSLTHKPARTHTHTHTCGTAGKWGRMSLTMRKRAPSASHGQSRVCSCALVFACTMPPCLCCNHLEQTPS